LYFLPEPHGQGSLRPTVFSEVTGAGGPPSDRFVVSDCRGGG
jgi:hypothetical protein